MFKCIAMGGVSTRFVTAAVMLVLGFSAASAAMGTDVFGGGATLPAGAYVGFNFLNPALKQSANTAFPTSGVAAVSSTSLFGAWAARTGNKVSYCQTGSSNGKKIFDNFDGTNHFTAIGACDGTSIGFGAPSNILVNPHFAGSDAPMSVADYSGFLMGGKVVANGQPVQFPTLAGSIAVIYRKDSLSTPLNLTSAQVCGVFNGSITQWSALTGNASDTSTIKVAFRSDGSGTSFSLANHMAAACAGTASQHFIVDQSFATAISQYKPTIPSGWVGVTGSPTVVAAVESADGTIGYAESANLKAAASTVPHVKYATVGGKDPYADFPASLAVLWLIDRALSAVPDAKSGRPIVAAVTPNVAPRCLLLVDPAAYANITSRYPIMGVSYLLANYQGNGADVAAVRGLIGSAYGDHSNVDTVGPNTGYAFLFGGPLLNQDAVDACVNP
ncbi:substrate-binding domain-containing protein [Luteibacter sp. E-22]|uniref:substrate-binding domain-containing protein n=1 Tax=Luteibacter sp. E-22 TaxID=3404050 RepID=UPI003CEB5F94